MKNPFYPLAHRHFQGQAGGNQGFSIPKIGGHPAEFPGDHAAALAANGYGLLRCRLKSGSHRTQKDSCLTRDCQQVRTMEKTLVNEGVSRNLLEFATKNDPFDP